MSPQSSISDFRQKFKARFENVRQRRLIRIILNKYFIVTSLFLVWICFFDTNCLKVFIQTQRKLRAQREVISDYKRKIEETDRKMQQLKSQRDSLEKFAREEYLYLEDDETVYVIY